MLNQNPYKSSQLQEVPVVAEDAALPRLHWRCMNWTAAFSINLIVPVIFGLIFADNNAKIGAAAVFTMLYGLGVWICATIPRFYKPLTRTAYFLALTQLLPLLQLLIGLLAHFLVGKMGYVLPYHKVTQPEKSGIVSSVNGGMLLALFYAIPLALTPALAELLSFLQTVPKRLFGSATKADKSN